jgi:hypothetical protein
VRARGGLAILAVCAAGAAAEAEASPPVGFHEATASSAPDDAGAASIDATAWVDLRLDWLHRLPRSERGPVLVGASVELPLLLWARAGSADTVRLAARAAWSPMRRGPLALAVDARTSLRTQRSYMDTLVGWDAALVVEPGLRWPRGSVALVLGVEQGLSTYVRPSGYAADAFEDRYPDGVDGAFDGPRSGWIALPWRRYVTGVTGGVQVNRRAAVTLSAGLVFLETSYDTGLFDTMAMGVWPFFASAGACVWF